jgi:sugar lactone lactonase YvrE
VGHSRVYRVTAAGAIEFVTGGAALNSQGEGDGGPAALARFKFVLDIALDGAGNLYIADSDANRIRRVSPDRRINAFAGDGVPYFRGDGGSALLASLFKPSGLAVDTAGNLYIADMENNRVRKVATDGVISTIAGAGVAGYSGDGGPATAARLNKPLKVAVDVAGNLYINDSSRRMAT